MAFEKKQSKNVKKFHYLERLWLFMNEGDGCGGIWYWRWQGVNYVNQMRAQWASVPYILLKKDSRETGNLVIFWFRSREFAAKREFRSLFDAVRIGFGGYGRQNQGFLLCFCLLWGPRGTFLEVAVDKIKAFHSIFVYFERRAETFWG